MTEFGYEEAVACLRQSLEDARAQARAFGVRSRGRPERLSASTWAELAQIEALLVQRLTETLARELHVAPLPWWREMRSTARGLWMGVTGEAALVRGVFERTGAHPVAEWRAAAPQLEPRLWPLFCDRVHYLANTCALALDEPAPYPTLIWQPREQRFRR